MSIEPRFNECFSCVHFCRSRISRYCLECRSGEFFEEKINDEAPSDEALMSMYESYYDE